MRAHNSAYGGHLSQRLHYTMQKGATLHTSPLPGGSRASTRSLLALLLLAAGSLPRAWALQVSADKLPTWVVPTDLSSLPTTRVAGGAFFNGSAMVLTGGATDYGATTNPMAPVSSFPIGACLAGGGLLD